MSAGWQRTACALVLLLPGCGDPGAGARIEGARKPAAVVAASPQGASGKLVLFGDLHVHTSYSWDGALGSTATSAATASSPPSAIARARACSTR